MRFMKMITTLFTLATATATIAAPSYAASVLSEILSGGVKSWHNRRLEPNDNEGPCEQQLHRV